ncbi:LuxR family transcriptional regulator [Agromyces protaetiae]|uniref:LuxR family transcriptional regulator n=1 Tax=Agromyces protaetiae TaxID=2509455 RepID=A0A4P6F9C5_9MICO|nr:helix-turn-helix transcriptional regulator [Agromyces protaetiae]QAY72156.1 LuxR family transcriptional regulator [Agromyces protaetiae]
MATPADAAEQADALLERAAAAFGAGDAFAAWALCEEAAALGREIPDASVLARAALVVRGLVSGELAARVHALCEEALARLDGEIAAAGAADARERDILRVRVRAQRAATTDLWATRPEDHPAAAALAAAEASGDALAILLALDARRQSLSNQLHARDWLALGTRAIDLGHRIGDAERVAWGRFCRIDAFWMLGERPELEHELRAVTADSMLDRDPSIAWRLGLVQASLALHDGKFDLAARLADRAHAIARTNGLGDGEFFDMVFRTHFTAQAGPDPVVDARTERMIHGVVDSGVFLGRLYLASFLSDRGRDAEAAAEWRLVRGRLGEVPRHLHEFVVGLADAAKICVRQGDLETARLLYGELAPYAGMQVIGSCWTPSVGPADLYLGVLAELLGDDDAAEAYALAARESAISMGSPTFEAWALLVLVRIARRREADVGRAGGAAGGGRAAREYAAAAREIGERLGWSMFLAQLDAATVRDDRGGLSRREYEIAGLVASGRSNRQIADELFLSERTVESHVTHIFGKLGVATRVEVATWHASRDIRAGR